MAAKPRLELFENPELGTIEKDILSETDESEDTDSVDDGLPQMTGTLQKWTNYLHGWQDRYIVLKDGALTYFKSETDRSYGCRGAVSLAKAIITAHPVDECRFDINVNDNVWYLRAESSDERVTWFSALELHRQAESGYGSMNSLKRQGSLLSITSGTSMSNISTSSFKRGRGLVEKLAEMETFRDILCRQVDTLQSYFDACAQALSVIQKNKSVHDFDHDDLDDSPDLDPLSGHTSPLASPQITGDAGSAPVLGPDFEDASLLNIFQQHGAHAIDFKGEAITFKATTAGIIATLSHSLELMSQREETWRKRLEKETEKRKKFEDLYRSVRDTTKKPIIIGGPDYEEGPTCVIKEDEFFDAVDASMDRLEFEAEKNLTAAAIIKPKPTADTPGSVVTLPQGHYFAPQIDSVVEEHIKFASMGIDNSVWEAIHDEGEMKVYRREMEEDGMIVDPLKAVHTVKGITGHELCHYFWDVGVRMEWEGTLDSTNVLEFVADDTVVSHQVHKRVWPTTQRDAVFWSHIRHVANENAAQPDMWIVVNYSCDHDKALSSKCVRVKMNVAMICETIVTPRKDGGPASRDDITCNIQYAANVNPGGWAPPSVLRAVYKREYPKFLKRFTQYVMDSTKNKPIMF